MAKQEIIAPHAPVADSAQNTFQQVCRIPHSVLRILSMGVLCLGLAFSLIVLGACTHSINSGEELSQEASAPKSEVEIKQSWNGDYPVDRLATLPEKADRSGIGYIAGSKSFGTVWAAFKPGDPEPDIDFKENMVLFVRNTQYYNRISIGKIMLKNGVVEVLAMETLSARPIEDMVAISMAVVSRNGIEGIQARDGVIEVEGVR